MSQTVPMLPMVVPEPLRTQVLAMAPKMSDEASFKPPDSPR